ncbi:hypothetical protein ACE1AT_01205 [Pelatocladus sp. BLCC-F211]|uniref:hypothetical protein n=1 Tax=Pelatocladus sp. BLCC-F211 TaxID=3342752 RepID=UPI0035B9561A
MMGKFYPLTPEMSQKLRKSKLTKHEMALWLYLIEKDPFGDRYWQLPSTLEITTELEMSKASYFRARARLQELELFDFQEQRVDCRNLTGVSKMRLESQKCDSQSQKRENQASKPASDNDSSTPQIDQTYSDFIKTLSEEERANFLNFCQEKIKNLSQEVNDIEAWLAHQNKAGQNRWEVYYEKYLASKQTQAKKAATNNALDEFRRELEERQQQAQRAWEESQNKNWDETIGGAT